RCDGRARCGRASRAGRGRRPGAARLRAGEARFGCRCGSDQRRARGRAGRCAARRDHLRLARRGARRRRGARGAAPGAGAGPVRRDRRASPHAAGHDASRARGGPGRLRPQREGRSTGGHGIPAAETGQGLWLAPLERRGAPLGPLGPRLDAGSSPRGAHRGGRRRHGAQEHGDLGRARRADGPSAPARHFGGAGDMRPGRGRTPSVGLAALLAAGVIVGRSALAAAQTEPRLAHAARLAQEGLGDSARAEVQRLLDATQSTDTLYPQILYARAVVAASPQDMRRDLQRVTTEYAASTWADRALLRLAQLDYAGNDLESSARNLERLRLDYPASPIYAQAAFWAGRVYFDLRRPPSACRWLAEGLPRV